MATCWMVIGAPDDADSFVRRFGTQRDAVRWAADHVMYCDEGWDREQLEQTLRRGATCGLGDAGSIRITKGAGST